MKADEPRPIVGYMLVGDDGRIAAIGTGAPPEGMTTASILDATGKIIVPGFVSAHSHIWFSPFRGLAADQYTPGWLNALRRYTVHATNDDVYWFTLHGALDHLLHGITTAFNFGFNLRAGCEHSEYEIRALQESGMRFVHGYAQLRTVSEEDQYNNFARFDQIATSLLRESRLLRVGIAGSKESLREVKFDKRLMEDFGVLNQTHLLEAPNLREQEQRDFKNFVSTGSLGPDFYFGHFIHTTDEMLERVAEAGSGMSWQPLSNGRLAAGVADIPKYLSLGVNVGMGVDGQASADLADPFENMRTGLYVLRSKFEDPSTLQPMDILRLHTLGSSRVMGVADRVGSLEVGKFADFNVITPPTPVFDPYATIVFASNVMNLEAVYVGGQKLVNHGSLTRSDLLKTNAQVCARVSRISTFVTG
jgi:5-methylthioadenosine/S-adenosylhomocysteine deaminase